MPSPIATANAIKARALTLPLQRILDAELAAGNFVADVSSWPPSCTVLVILGRSFMTSAFTSAEVTFHEINDPHYWKAEYRFKGGVETLACRF